jgi:hypothetical protein
MPRGGDAHLWIKVMMHNGRQANCLRQRSGVSSIYYFIRHYDEDNNVGMENLLLRDDDL